MFILPIFPVRGRGVCFMVDRETVGAQERIKVGCPSCRHRWLFWDLNPRLTVCKSCILTTKPRLLPSFSYKSYVEIFGSTLDAVRTRESNVLSHSRQMRTSQLLIPRETKRRSGLIASTAPTLLKKKFVLHLYIPILICGHNLLVFLFFLVRHPVRGCQFAISRSVLTCSTLLSIVEWLSGSHGS